MNSTIQQRNQLNRVASGSDSQNKFDDYGRVEAQRKLSPLQDTVDNHVGPDGTPNGQPFVQHSAFLDTQGEAAAAMGHFDSAGFYPGYELIPEGMEMQEADHFMMGPAEPQHRHQNGIFNEFIKADDHHAHQHDQGAYAHQPLDQDNQLAAIALHRSQSVMLPQTHHQMSVYYGNGLMEAHPSLVANNLGAGSFEQFNNQYENQVNQPGRVARPKRESGKSANQMMDPFFDESAQELSSIEHSHNAAAAEAYYQHQMGYNPYEQAKRQALKQQSSVENVRTRKETQAPTGLFVSPMGADMHTPQGKQDGQSGRAVPMITMIGQEGTPSHFMSGVEVGGDRTNLAHGHHGEHLQPHNNPHHHQPQQLSVGRMYGADPLGMSAGYHVDGRQEVSGQGHSIAMHHAEHDLSNMRGTFGNTPAGFAAHHNDPHRQNLSVSVSGWNLDDQVVVQGQQQRAAARAEPIYQGMPDAYM